MAIDWSEFTTTRIGERMPKTHPMDFNPKEKTMADPKSPTKGATGPAAATKEADKQRLTKLEGEVAAKKAEVAAQEAEIHQIKVRLGDEPAALVPAGGGGGEDHHNPTTSWVPGPPNDAPPPPDPTPPDGETPPPGNGATGDTGATGAERGAHGAAHGAHDAHGGRGTRNEATGRFE